MGRLQDKVAIVTGGASGIGEATVRLFVAEGARVVIADLQSDAGEALASELGEAAMFARVDVSVEEDVRQMVKGALDRWAQLDVMFNNAGLLGPLNGIANLDVAGLDRCFAIMVRGAALGMKYAARAMVPRRQGCIINTASIASLTAGYGGHAYTGAKHAVLGLTRSAAMELGLSNVRVNALCPGGVLTPMNINAMGGGESARTGVEQHLSKMQPLPRVGQPEDMARAVLFLACAESGFANGAPFIIDGGATAGAPWNPMMASDDAQ